MHEQIFDAIHGNINSHNSTIMDIMHTQFMQNLKFEKHKVRSYIMVNVHAIRAAKMSR